MIDYELKRGSHDSPEGGLCAMEWVAYLAGEEHGDSPRCVDRPLREFSIALNDALGDEDRQRLRPYLARCIGTAGDGQTERRMWLMVDFAVREAAPVALEMEGLMATATTLRALPEVVDRATADSARAAARAAPTDADAARAAYAARAARHAARAATHAAHAARAAYAARAAAHATHAADAAARAAAHAAAADAADALLALYDRMLPTEPVELPAARRADLERLLSA